MSEIAVSSFERSWMPRQQGPMTPLLNYSPGWFAVFTVPRHEKKVAHHFIDRQIETFLPLFSETKRWKNRCKVKVELPLFPCYIFTRIDRRERGRVLDVPGVVDIIGCTADAVPVSDECIETLRRGVQLGKIQRHDDVTVGDKVRITDGPMMGMEGLLVRLKNDLRVVLRLDMIMQSIAIEVSIDEIERVA